MPELRRVPNRGPERARIMIVGEAPGEQEEREGQPFIGPAGKLLRQFLLEVGIDPEDVFYANICKFRPPGNKLEKFFEDGGVPQPLVLQGIVELKEDILRIRPNVIVAAGNFPLWALTKKARWFSKTQDGKPIRGFMGVSDWRGSVLQCTLVPGFKVLSTFHPSYIAREGMADHGVFKLDLWKAKEESAFPEIIRPRKDIVVLEKEPQRLVGFQTDEGELVQVWADGKGPRPILQPVWEPYGRSREEIRSEVLINLPPAPEANVFATPLELLTVDIEMMGSSCYCIGFTDQKDRAFVLPTRTMADFVYAGSILESGVGINAQNSMFDGSMVEWHLGMEIMSRVRFDTMFAAHSAEIELAKGLDSLVSYHLTVPYHKNMVDWKAVKKGQQNMSMLYAYNGVDVWTQHEIAEIQIRDQLDSKKIRDIFLFEMMLLNPLWQMSKRGIRIDFELLNAERTFLKEEAARLNIELLLMAGRPINARPSNDCRWFLYERMRLPVLKSGSSGASTDDKTLAALAVARNTSEEQRRAVTLVRQYRTAVNLMSKFFDLEFDDDGRMRGHYDPTKTVTGRLASRKFYPTGKGTNQQNIPRDKRARRVFVADLTKLFFYADLERAESLVVAHITGDPRMLQDHAPGVDAHRSLAAALYNVGESEVTDDQRAIGKRTRHAGNYMQGPITFMKNFNQDAHKTGLSIEYKEADFLIKTYRSLHPFLERWWNETKAQLYRTRTLENLLGRQRVFYGHIGSIIPEAVAFNPQSTVGDTLNIAFLTMEGICAPYLDSRGIWEDYRDIAEELRDCGFEALMQIHDAVAGQVNEKDAERALPLIRKAMEIPLRNPRTYEDFVIPAEILADFDPAHLEAGDWKSSWGDCLAVTLREGRGERELLLKDGKLKGYAIHQSR